MISNRYAILSDAGDLLEPLDAMTGRFSGRLWRTQKLDGMQAGLPDSVLILQLGHNLSDECLQFQTDQLSFKCFLELYLAENVLDAHMILAFLENLKNHDLIDALLVHIKALIRLKVFKFDRISACPVPNVT